MHSHWTPSLCIEHRRCHTRSRQGGSGKRYSSNYCSSGVHSAVYMYFTTCNDCHYFSLQLPNPNIATLRATSLSLVSLDSPLVFRQTLYIGNRSMYAASANERIPRIYSIHVRNILRKMSVPGVCMIFLQYHRMAMIPIVPSALSLDLQDSKPI